MAGDQPRISLCMIARDEEENLPLSLESARGLADEMIVVDTGSEDRTAELARRQGARVVVFPWQEDFSRARNAALDHGAHFQARLLSLYPFAGPGRDLLTSDRGPGPPMRRRIPEHLSRTGAIGLATADHSPTQTDLMLTNSLIP